MHRVKWRHSNLWSLYTISMLWGDTAHYVKKISVLSLCDYKKVMSQ